MAVERIAVVGAGLMGHGIAQVFAQAGHAVALHDPDPDTLNSAPERIAANLRRLGRDAGAAHRVTLHGELGSAVEGAAFVFEAAPEKLSLKQAIFVELDEVTPENVVLATNTSVIPVGQIAERVKRAGRVVGTHWWNPPYLVALVEVVQAQRSAAATVERTISLLRAVGQDPVHVRRDVPGFVGNRLQHALWREAFALVADGVCDAETIDRVVTAGFGRRLPVMGPIETADYIGLDLTLDIHEQILHDLDRSPGPSPLLRELVDRGDLGMKSGRGFRQWKRGDQADARDRLLAHLQRLESETP